MTHAELTRAGFEVSASVHARLALYVECLLEENRKLNLTSVRDPAEVWAVHIGDSLALLPLVRESGPRRLLDLGTGGGLPGIPLAIACDGLHVTLLDSTRKKIAAVERMLESLALTNVTTVWARAEALARDPLHRETYDAVTARAIARLARLIEFSTGLLHVGGFGWFYKSRDGVEDEIREAEHAARKCALKYEETRDYRLPGRHGRRVLVCYRKVEPLRKDLPRRFRT